MKILLIGNFAPPYEEENLHNITLFNKLVEDGHQCTVINISESPSVNSAFIDASSNAAYLLTLLRHSLSKDIIHFLTKGYLRVGLLKMMLSIFAAKIFRAKAIITIHSEFFSILGQMRSPFGGTQTLSTSFYLADKIIFADKDTYDVAVMYKKKPNFELIPSFIYVHEEIDLSETSQTAKMKGMKHIIFLTNVTHPSFLFETLNELLSHHCLPADTGIVIAPSDKSSLQLEHAIEDTGRELKDRMTFIEYDDINSALKTLARSSIILRPMSCDGTTFFEGITMCAKKVFRSGSYIYFPNGMVFVKEGAASRVCANMITGMISTDAGPDSASDPQSSYEKIIKIYSD